MSSKILGVVEGFYRRPYTHAQRMELLSFIAVCGMNTYVYGPKSDPFHRKLWKQLYPKNKLREFAELIERAQALGIHFNYALSPMTDPEPDSVVRKIASMMKTGIHDFSLFFDDIKAPLNEDTALQQLRTACTVMDYLQARIFNPVLLFCPTQYRGFEKSEYITTIAAKLPRNIHLFWTGRRVVSKRITEKDLIRITEIIKRPPLIWDNLFANDYLPGVIWKFPYQYRTPSLLRQTRGVLINPMNHLQPSKPLIYTASLFFNDPLHYTPKRAWQKARRLGLIT